LKDKIRIALALDDLGVDYIEGGWPGSNPKDAAFFKEIREHKLKNSKVAAFCSTMYKGNAPEKDNNLSAVLDSGVDIAVMFGKSWLLHVNNVLKVTREENLDLIYLSISYLRAHGLRVIFDAEHFYQGFLDNAEYARAVLKTAKDAGSDTLVLADTNGGTTTNDIFEITKQLTSTMSAKFGVHIHNDSGCAVSNTLMGVIAGATHIQGTINGLGERTGNADLVQILPTLELKLGRKVLKQNSLPKLKKVSALIYELSGILPNPSQPFVGANAFAHKGGMHSDAVMKDAKAYEHIDPESVGNTRKIVVSELSGASSLVGYAKEHGVLLDKSDGKLKEALTRIKELESEGYSFDLAPESALLVLLEKLGMYKNHIRLDYWQVTSEKGADIAVVKTGSACETAKGKGPVNAVDIALRRALSKTYPEIAKLSLTDYRVILPGSINSTESKVRVTVELSDGASKWRTMGVSNSIVDASIMALLDGVNYYLWKNNIEQREQSTQG